MKKRAFQIAGVGIASIFIGIAWFFYWPRRYDAGLATIKVGDERKLVLQIMGRPWQDEGCGIYLQGAAPGCAEQLYYANPLAPLVPKYWIVELDSSKHVINTVTVTSP